MTFYAEPTYTRTRVDKAGYRVAVGEETAEDIDVIENWRASHAQILNTFKQVLYNRSKKFNCLVVQRLKRRPTIVSKLSRDPEMRVRLSQMQDIAGCRLIFDSEEDLYEFKHLMDTGRFDHKLKYEKDYIKKPKEDGYQGIHQIYTYQVEPRKGHASANQPWNGMRVEIQYRTLRQHIWSTAVETAGSLTANNPKLKQGSRTFVDFFRICSEMLSRHYEFKKACLPDLSNTELCKEFRRLKDETHIIEVFNSFDPQVTGFSQHKTSILIFNFESRTTASSIQVLSYDSMNEGIREYNRIEKELSGAADVVLVKAENQSAVRSAYRNYFADTTDFVHFVIDAEDALRAR